MRTLLLLVALATLLHPDSRAAKREFYEIKIYHITGPDQEKLVDNYLRNAYLPALHRAGIQDIGVFKPIEDDPEAGKRIYVLLPFRNLKQYLELPDVLSKDAQFQGAGKEYIDAAFDNPPYVRMEAILLRAFADWPVHTRPNLSTPAAERIFELRSYEGPTEKLYRSKVHMFNEGEEISIFTRLGFNAVFYAEVLAGSRMPNLMYMTSFENRASRESHWKAFGEDAFWKKISALPQYQHTVSKADIFLLHPTEYSDL